MWKFPTDKKKTIYKHQRSASFCSTTLREEFDNDSQITTNSIQSKVSLSSTSTIETPAKTNDKQSKI